MTDSVLTKREGDRIGVGRRERMKRGIGMKDRDERSRGIVIHIADAFAIIKPTVPFKLAKHQVLRKRNWSISQNRCFTVRIQKQKTNKFVTYTHA